MESETESVTLYVAGSEPLVYKGELNPKDLASWITRETLPTIIPLSGQGAMDYVFSENKGDIVIIVKYRDIAQSQLDIIESFCEENQEEFVCTIVTKEDEIYDGVNGFFKFQDEEENKLTWIEAGYSNAFIANFKPEEATSEQLKQWKNNIVEGKEESVISAGGGGDEAIEYQSVVVLNGENFNTYVEENEQTFVEFYADFCGHCKAFAPTYEKFAEEMIAAGSEYKIAAVNC